MVQKNIVLLKPKQLEFVLLPVNVTKFCYNSFKRDFEGVELNFGRIVFRKVLPSKGSSSLCCHYETGEDLTAIWFLEEIVE